jgi:photosystem II stability/assembly factor-like uncharacterized protein
MRIDVVGVAGLGVLLLLAAGCGGSKQSAATVSTATISTTTTVSRTTTTAPSTGSAVPVGFVPQSFTAISESDYWVLGSVPCAGGRCTAIARTTDGGASFSTIRAPELQNVGTPGRGEPTLRFADHDDGYAFVTGAGGVFYATHDGGTSWQRVGQRSLIAFATGGGYVYAVTAACTPDRCTALRFERSPVSRDVWTTSAMPFAPASSVLDLSAHGSSVWLLGTRSGQVASRYDVLARSTDAGQTFAVGDGPCSPDLGGTLAPSSASVVWAVCPTGMMAGAARSTDGGVTFAPLNLQKSIPNSTRLAPASDDSAMLIINAAGASPLLMTDAGARWTTPRTPTGATSWAWAGFTDTKTGAALVQTRYDAAARIELQQLWRTTDGGSSWSNVRFRSR